MSIYLVTEIANVYYEFDEEFKAKKAVVLNNEILPFYMDRFEKMAAENNGHLACKRVSIA